METITVGKDKHIAWLDFDDGVKELFDTNYIIDKYPDFWKELETVCYAECCGIDAYCFFPEDIKRASSTINKQQLISDLEQLKKDVLLSDLEVVVSSRLNQLIHKTTFTQLLDHFIENLSA